MRVTVSANVESTGESKPTGSSAAFARPKSRGRTLNKPVDQVTLSARTINLSGAEPTK